MTKRTALVLVSGSLMAAVACGGSSGGGPVGSQDAAGDTAPEQEQEGGGSSGSSGGSATDGATPGTDSTVSEMDGGADADATLSESGAVSDGAAEAAVSESEASADAGADAAYTLLFDGSPDASPSYCGVWTELSASTTEAFVGTTLTLSATATGTVPASLGYTWTQSPQTDGGAVGLFGAAQDEAAGPSDAMSFLCTSPGTTTVTLTVDDGPIPDGGACPTSATTVSINLTCNAAPATQVESAWVELGSTSSGDGGSNGTNTVIARAITAAGTCPTITLNGGTAQAMNTRIAAATIPVRTTVSTAFGPTYSKPSAFPVQTCELYLPAGTTSAVVNAALAGGTQGITLPLPKANIQRIVVIGDTGCRMQSGGPSSPSTSQWQSCSDPTQYAFGAVATAAAALHPDLVLHVGDYDYRDNECPPDVAGCAGAPWGYGWDTWQADFFKPGQPLLTAAPWIVNRGNHEQCTRSGQGWYRFLDTNPFNETQSCDLPANDNAGSYNNVYAVNIGSDSQILTFDSNNVAKAAITAGGANAFMFNAYQTEMLQAAALATNPNMFNIWSNHHPILGFAGNVGAPPSPGQPALTSVMEATFPTTFFPPNINMALHGHTHLFEAIDFSPPSTDTTQVTPATFVTGNAGTLLDTALPNPFPGEDAGDAAVTAASGANVVNIADSAGFGFLLLEFQPGDASTSPTWLVTEYKEDGVTVRSQCVAQLNGQTSCNTWGYIP